VGAGVSLGGGFASVGGAANAANSAASTVNAAVRAGGQASSLLQRIAGVTRTGAQVGLGLARETQGVWSIRAAVSTHDADDARADGVAHQAAAQRASMRMDDLIDVLREVLQRGRREVERAANGLAEQGRVQHAMVSNVGRA